MELSDLFQQSMNSAVQAIATEGITTRAGIRHAGVPGLEADEARTVFLSALGALVALGAAVAGAHK